MEEAEHYTQIYNQTYPTLCAWQSEHQKRAETEGKIRTVGGRVIYFKDPAICYTESRNYPIQAAAADLQMLAIQRVYAALLQKGLPAHLVNFVHDELVLEVREDVVPDVSELLTQEMTQAFLDLFKSYLPEFLTQGLVEVGVGINYAQVK